MTFAGNLLLLPFEQVRLSPVVKAVRSTELHRLWESVVTYRTVNPHSRAVTVACSNHRGGHKYDVGRIFGVVIHGDIRLQRGQPSLFGFGFDSTVTPTIQLICGFREYSPLSTSHSARKGTRETRLTQRRRVPVITRIRIHFPIERGDNMDDDFRAAFDEVTNEVLSSRHQFFADRLKSWFEILDETPKIAGIVASLQRDIDIQEFLKASEGTRRSMVGSGVLNWPSEREKRLGTQLLLFREMAEKRIEAWQFGVNFIYAGNNLNDNVAAVADQLFQPFARELRRYLERQISDIPASDRVVRLDHNDPKYKEVMNALETLERALKESNDYDDSEDKEQKIAEVSAGQRLLRSVKVRIVALVAVLSTPLLYLAKKFLDTGIGKAATASYDALVALLGMIF